MRGHVPMQNPSRVDIQYYEDIQDAECCRHDDEEITREDLSVVAFQNYRASIGDKLPTKRTLQEP